MKLYNGLIRFFRLVNRLYFVDVHAAGQERMPEHGPLIVAANHPGSILDSILLATHVSRPIHYLARSGLFRWPVAASLFRQLGAIPIYRAHESNDHATRNAQVFAHVHELLDAGGCVGIFPEGQNSPAGQVGPLRTGAARLALAAEARNDWQLGLRIAPVGITYENHDFLMSAVMLGFAPPIRVDAYADQYQADPDAAIRRLTDDLQLALRRQTLHSEDRKLSELAAELTAVAAQRPYDEHRRGNPEPDDGNYREPLLKRWLWLGWGWYQRSSAASRRALEERVFSRQRINHALARAAGAEPAAVAALRKQVERYRDHMHQTRIRHALSTDPEQPLRDRLPRLRMTAYAIAAAPVALFGAIHNLVPYIVTHHTGRLFRDEPVRAFAWFGIGVVTFLATYTGIGVWLWRTTDLSSMATVAYIALLPPTGIVALGYRRALLLYRERILVRTFLWNRRDLLRLLEHEREVILARLNALMRRYPE
ncbi:1-acyl-sn-glycerol-3-phosphate acyltransferase [Halofilum ochraceum]|uniref:1-acyl-sn-glycerol-3-phosphate acyltransferase n=1 Tax=Halofilum ochraceum TaxID=1611323 RepID=UPI0008DAB36A|nr:1-acyl-sn-glycerol-3-phosphate acyltransferase [Halofilum ochraceum]